MKTDSEIQSDVLQELLCDPSVTHEHIGVAVTSGIVTLSGKVPSFAEKFAAEKAAQRIASVKAIVENIEVKLPSIYHRDDEDIAQAIVNQFKWSVQIPDTKIKTKVEKGWITLKGDLDWEFQRRAAERLVCSITGVRGVSNDLTIGAKKIESANVKQKIEEALKREAKREADKISVDVTGSRVTLKGSVKSFAEMDDAKWAAWCVPGVTNVENLLQISRL